MYSEEDILEKLERIKAQHEDLKGRELTKASDVRNLEQTLVEEEARAQKIGGTAEKEYKEWLAENITEKQLLRDVDIAYAVLNKAILAFHQEKMSLINRIIHVRTVADNKVDTYKFQFNVVMCAVILTISKQASKPQAP